MNCDFDNPAMTCPTCGYRARRLPTYRECRPVPKKAWKPIAVGDLVERWLTRFGITRERVERWTRTEGTPGGCGCEARKRWLNEAGNRVQVWCRQRLLKAREFYYGV